MPRYDVARDDPRGWGLPGVECAPCPVGATCYGATYPPTNKRGYWGSSGDPHEFYEADNADKNFACRRGWKGRMCLTIRSPDYYFVGELGPFACPRQPWGKWALVCGGFALVLCIWVWVNNTVLHDYPSLDLMTYFIQLMAIVCRFNYAYSPANVEYYELVLDIALFDIDILKPSCLMPWNFARSILAQFGVVIVGFMVYMTPLAYKIARKLADDPAFRSVGRVAGSLRYYGGEYGVETARGLAAVLSLIDVQQTTMAYNAFSSLRCDAFVGESENFLREMPDVSCHSALGYFIRGFGVLTIAVVVVGIPTLQAATISYECESHGGVHHNHMQDYLGWAYEMFRHPNHAWRIRRTYVSVGICACATLVDNCLLQSVLAILVMLNAYAEQKRATPYIEARLNDLEAYGQAFVRAENFHRAGSSDDIFRAPYRARHGPFGSFASLFHDLETSGTDLISQIRSLVTMVNA